MAFVAFAIEGIACRRYGEGETSLVLAHGAGAGQEHAFMVRYAEGLAARGLCVVTFDFRYRTLKRGIPDRMPILEETYRAVVAGVRGKGRLAIGGKSMGGRVASMIAASDSSIADALVFLGYPLHPPSQPDKLRAAHLPKIEAPMLFVQGERDTFGTPAELAPILATLPRAKLLTITSGDHSLSVPKRVRSQADVDDVIQSAIVDFVRA